MRGCVRRLVRHQIIPQALSEGLDVSGLSGEVLMTKKELVMT